jgi:ElaB/YqjD/DUF883 family membrane-anchored ribosome-binding protein
MENQMSESLGKVNGALRDFKPATKSSENNLERISHDIGQSVGSLAKSFTGTVSDYSRASSEYVRENPAKGVAIAAVTGAVLGSLLTLSYRRRS